MIDIRIVCTYDAVKLAETLMRLLEAEEHQVRLCFGRNSLNELEQARAAAEAVLVIWSPDAPSQHYMLEWSRSIDPQRLVEIARASGWPRGERNAPVIDFMSWRGERGARAWNALNERLRAVARHIEPPKPPSKQATLALGLASIAAVSGAAFVRMGDAPSVAPQVETGAATSVIARVEPETGVGGALTLEEPPSEEDLQRAMTVQAPRIAQLEITRASNLVEMAEYDAPDLRDPTLFERLLSLNPLRTETNDG